MDANVISHGQSQAAGNDMNGAQVNEHDTAQAKVTSKRCRKNNKVNPPNHIMIMRWKSVVGGYHQELRLILIN